MKQKRLSLVPCLLALILLLALCACGDGSRGEAAREPEESLTGVWECGNTVLLDQVWIYEDGTFAFNAFLAGTSLGDAVTGTWSREDDRLNLSLPDEEDWVYFQIVHKDDDTVLIKNDVDEYVRVGDIDDAPAEKAADTADVLLDIENQLQGTWYAINGEGTMEEYMTFADGEYSEDSYYLGEKLGDTRYGTYSVTFDSIPVSTANSDGRMVDGELLYSYEDGRLSLLSRTGGSIQKLYDGPELSEPSNAQSRPSGSQKTGSQVAGGSDSGKTSGSTTSATTGQQNALKQAKLYLELTGFSYSGLIEQLEFEGYTHSEAVYGADNCGADWYEQAARKAAEYLDLMPFSRDDLIDQLEFEGFTYDQAVYGVEHNGY